jgi:hypothetical protein
MTYPVGKLVNFSNFLPLNNPPSLYHQKTKKIVKY